MGKSDSLNYYLLNFWLIHVNLKSQEMTYSDDPNHFADKGPSSQSYGFPNSRVEMWELDHKGWALKNSFFQAVVLEKTLESPLESKIKPVNP